MEIVNYGYIYETINKKNGMFYIGKSKGIFNPNYYGSGIVLKRAINKYGIDSFHTRLINYVETKKQLNEMEKIYIFVYREMYGREKLYNISNGGDGGPLFQGHKHSDKTREKMRLTSLGKPSGMKGKPFPEEAKEKNRQKHIGKPSPFKDKHHTKTTKEKIRQAKLGIKRKPFTEEHIRNMIKNHVGMLGKIPWNKGLHKGEKK